MTDMLDALRDLERITATPGRGCTRIAYTHFEDQAHDYVWDCLKDIPGLRRVEDAAGNTFIVPSAAIAEGGPPVLVGSHLDTVIEGGWLDGSMGVVAAMHVLRRRAGPAGASPDVGLVMYRDEEGVRFNTGLFGSKVFAGKCGPDDLNAIDGGGVRVADVVPDPAGCCNYEPPVRAAVFLECHIEQGARLVESGRRIGLVTGIVGIRRFELVGLGLANHAGTTDMKRRVDALVPIAEIVSRLPSLVQDMESAVITCGRLQVEPGAPNVIPGTATAVVEIRAGDDAELDEIENRLRNAASDASSAASANRTAHIALRSLVKIAPTSTDRVVRDLLADVLTDRQITFEALVSMAGHDTQQVSHRCQTGMFFIPSIDGVSHNATENSRDEDIELAGEVMTAWAERCLALCS